MTLALSHICSSTQSLEHLTRSKHTLWLQPYSLSDITENLCSASGSQKSQRKKAAGPAPVINKSKKGFGRAKEEQHVEQTQRFSSSAILESEEDALLFALEFIEFYAVRGFHGYCTECKVRRPQFAL